MGMFDNVTMNYPVPELPDHEWEWQSKDTPAQYLDHYEIREDGTLWHHAYDARVEDNDDDAPLGFLMYRDNERWERVLFDGELEIHDVQGDTFYSLRCWFRGGVVRDMIVTKGGD